LDPHRADVELRVTQIDSALEADISR